MNRAYLLSLDDALRELSPASGDEHVTDLAERVRAIMSRAEEEDDGAEGQNGDQGRNSDEAAAASHGFPGAGSVVEEQEETEKRQ